MSGARSGSAGRVRQTRGSGGFFRRAGWIGTALLAGASFFLVGAIVSLLNGDMSVALQGLIVAALLTAGGLYVAARRKGR